MEIFRRRNQTTKVVFPLLDATSATKYYTTSAWESMTNATKSVYFWSNDGNAPTSSTIEANPVQIGSTGEWYLVISASEISANAQYMSIKLKSDQILEQTILVRITDYDASINTISTPVTVSGYQNFPQVNVSAINSVATTNVTAVNANQGTTQPINFVGTGNGAVVNVNLLSAGNTALTATQVTGGRLSVNVGAMSNNVITSNAITNGALVSAEFGADFFDRIASLIPSSFNVSSVTNFAITSSSFNNNYWNKVIEVQPSTVGVSAYYDFPQVIVSANLDKTGYSLGGPVSVSAYSNFPSVNVSSVSDGIFVSADFADDYWNKIYSLETTSVTVTAYENFPQVYVSGGGIVSANVVQWNGQTPNNLISGRVDSNAQVVGDKTGYSVIDGTINSVLNPVSVSAQTNHPPVQVSAVNGGLYIGTSAYTNFPQVTVSAIVDGVISSADFNSTYWTRVQEGLATDSKLTEVKDIVYVINTNTSGISGLATSESIDILQNTVNAISSVTDNFTFTENAVNAYTTNEVVVSAYNNFPKVHVSGIDNGITFSADVTIDYDAIKNANISAIDEKFEFSGSNVKAYSVNETVLPGAFRVSAYDNFPEVQVSGINNGVYVGVNSYQNFPEVKVSAIKDEIISSANFVDDYWNRVQIGLATSNQILSIQDTVNEISAVTNQFTFNGSAVNAYSTNEFVMPEAVVVSGYQNFPQVQVSGINTGVYGSVSAFMNMPQVTVSANLDKTGYTVSSATDDFFNTVHQGIATSAQVDNVQNTVNDIKSITDQFSFTDGSVDAYVKIFNPVAVSAIDSSIITNIGNEVWNSSIAYNNFPSVNVSSVSEGLLPTINDLSAVSAGIINHGDGYWTVSSCELPISTIISAACVSAIKDQFTFVSNGSENLVKAWVSGGSVSADPNTIVAALLSTTVDGKTFEQLMEILLAMATGRITRVNNKFTYYKQDNTTALYTLESERNERTRLNG